MTSPPHDSNVRLSAAPPSRNGSTLMATYSPSSPGVKGNCRMPTRNSGKARANSTDSTTRAPRVRSGRRDRRNTYTRNPPSPHPNIATEMATKV